MRRNLPLRFWLEAVTAVAGVVLLVVTLITREWIELLTGFDPDAGSGTFEFALAVGLLVIAVTSALAARANYRRAALPA